MELPTLKTSNCGDITFEGAVEEETNMVQRLTFFQKRIDFHVYLHENRANIEALVSFHLGLKSAEHCRLTQPADWVHGSFNLCLPVDVSTTSKQSTTRVIIRFPLPYKIGELEYPGNADEKLRCEAATYIWIAENCPDLPIPRLWGFGFSDNNHFTSLETVPFYKRWLKYLQRKFFALLKLPVPCPYIHSQNQSRLKTGYLLIDCIDEKDGKMLTKTWQDLRHDKFRRQNLFRGLCHIILSLGKTPLPRIGSFTMDNDGVISLTNRPLTCELQQLENGKIPTNINRHMTYTCIEPYLLDLFTLHDNRLAYQPNAVWDESDCRSQMAVLTGMRSLLHHFYSRHLREGPFLFTLTDLSHSNIFVDDDWNAKYVIDLEWACTLPVEMQQPPYWLTDRGVDGLTGENFVAFDEFRKEFMEAFAEKEKQLIKTKPNTWTRTQLMEDSWNTGKFFYFYGLNSTAGICNLFWSHLQPRFAPSHGTDEAFNRIFAAYWKSKSDEFVSAKVDDKQKYDKELRVIFENEKRTNQQKDLISTFERAEPRL